MRRLLLLVLMVVAATVSGCVKYRVTLNNGQTFTVLGKPKYDETEGIYRYKSGGEEQIISAGRVVSIEPAGDPRDGKPQSSGY